MMEGLNISDELSPISESIIVKVSRVRCTLQLLALFSFPLDASTVSDIKTGPSSAEHDEDK